MQEVRISEAEWEIMRVAWTMKETTSSEIIDVLANKMEWKTATIKTLIGRLVKKDLLKTEKNGRKYIYSPTVNEEETVLDAGHDFLDQICDTKVGHTLAELIKDSAISQGDIEEIEKILTEKKETAPEVVQCNCLPGQCDCHMKGAS